MCCLLSKLVAGQRIELCSSLFVGQEPSPEGDPAMAPGAGFEPALFSLTVRRLAAWLPRNELRCCYSVVKELEHTGVAGRIRTGVDRVTACRLKPDSATATLIAGRSRTRDRQPCK